MKVNVLGIILLSTACAHVDESWEEYCTRVNREYDTLVGENSDKLDDIRGYGERAYNIEQLEKKLEEAQKNLGVNLVEACTMLIDSPASDYLREFLKVQATIGKTPNVMNCLLVPKVSTFKDPGQIYMALAASYGKPGVNMVIWNKTMLDADFTDLKNLEQTLFASNASFWNDLDSGVIKLNPEKPLSAINLATIESILQQLVDNDADESLRWLASKGFDLKLILWEYSMISKSSKIHKLLREHGAKVTFTERDIIDIVKTKNSTFHYLVAEYDVTGGNLKTLLSRISLRLKTFSEDDAILYDVLIKNGVDVHVRESARSKAAYRERNEDPGASFYALAWYAYCNCDPMNLKDIIQKHPNDNPRHNSSYCSASKCHNASNEDLQEIANWAKENGAKPHGPLFIEAVRRGDKRLWDTLFEATSEWEKNVVGLDWLYLEASKKSEVEMMKNLVKFGVPISEDKCWEAMSYARPEIQEALRPRCATVSFDPDQGYVLKNNIRGLLEWTQVDWTKKVWPEAVTDEHLNALRQKQEWKLALIVHRELWDKTSDNVECNSIALWDVLDDEIKERLIKYASPCLVLDMLEDGAIKKLNEDELEKISKVSYSSGYAQCLMSILRVNVVRGGPSIAKISPELPFKTANAGALQFLHQNFGFLPDQSYIEDVLEGIFGNGFDLVHFWVVDAKQTLDRNKAKSLVKEASSVPVDQFIMLVWLGAGEKKLNPKGKEKANEEVAIRVFNEFEDKKGLIDVYFLEYLAKHDFFNLFKQAFHNRSVPSSQVALYYLCGHGSLEWIKMIYDQFKVLPDERAKAHAAANEHYHVVDYIIRKENGPTAEESENAYENLEAVKYVYLMSGKLPDEKLLSGEVLEFVRAIKYSLTEGTRGDIDDAKGKEVQDQTRQATELTEESHQGDIDDAKGKGAEEQVATAKKTTEPAREASSPESNQGDLNNTK